MPPIPALRAHVNANIRLTLTAMSWAAVRLCAVDLALLDREGHRLDSAQATKVNGELTHGETTHAPHPLYIALSSALANETSEASVLGRQLIRLPRPRRAIEYRVLPHRVNRESPVRLRLPLLSHCQ
jgi:hypothetical protein